MSGQFIKAIIIMGLQLLATFAEIAFSKPTGKGRKEQANDKS